jgi:hypothetical protein
MERLKSGDTAASIRDRFEGLGLVPTDPPLPNPNDNRLLKWATEKVAKYRSALVVLIRRYGGQLIQELSMETGFTVGLSVNMGFPPSISVSIGYQAVAQTVEEMRWVAARPDAQQ